MSVTRHKSNRPKKEPQRLGNFAEEIPKEAITLETLKTKKCNVMVADSPLLNYQGKGVIATANIAADAIVTYYTGRIYNRNAKVESEYLIDVEYVDKDHKQWSLYKLDGNQFFVNNKWEPYIQANSARNEIDGAPIQPYSCGPIINDPFFTTETASTKRNEELGEGHYMTSKEILEKCNATFEKVFVGGINIKPGEWGVFEVKALRDIHKGEEILVHYGGFDYRTHFYKMVHIQVVGNLIQMNIGLMRK
jgi:SET domain